MNNYGNCECGEILIVGEWFTEEEFYPKTNIPTGRIRDSVAYLVCPSCLKKYAVDDTFDGEWRYKV